MPVRYALAPQVIETDLPDELVLLDPESQEMFTLNASGRSALRALQTGGTAAAAAGLCRAFAVSAERAAADVDALARALEDAGLVRAIAADAR